jgi:rubrerythrin
MENNMNEEAKKGIEEGQKDVKKMEGEAETERQMVILSALRDELEAIDKYLTMAESFDDDPHALGEIREIVADEVRHCKKLKSMFGQETLDTDESKAVEELDEMVRESFAKKDEAIAEPAK